MALFKTLMVTGSLIADRLIGNADTATNLKRQAVTGNIIANLAAGSYYHIANPSVKFTDLPTEIQNCNFNLEIIAISNSNKYQIIETYKELNGVVSEYLLVRNVVNNKTSAWFNMGYSAITFSIGEHLKLLINDKETNERSFRFKLGEEYKIEVIPINSSYKLKSFTMNGVEINSPYNFKVNNSSHAFVASESLDEATVNVTADKGIIVKINNTPVSSGAHRYNIGQELTITNVIDEAYNLTSFKLNNQNIVSGHKFILTADGANIVATSSIKTYFVKVFNPEHATIYINDQNKTEYTFTHGTEININAVPNTGYEIARLDVSEPEDIYKLIIPKSDTYTYTITNVTNGEPGIVEELKPEGYNASTLLKVNFKATNAYNITKIIRDGREYVNNSTFVVNYDNKFDVTTSIKMLNIKVTQPQNARIEVNGQVGDSFDLPAGTKVKIEAIPDAGYTIEHLYVTEV